MARLSICFKIAGLLNLRLLSSSSAWRQRAGSSLFNSERIRSRVSCSPMSAMLNAPLPYTRINPFHRLSLCEEKRDEDCLVPLTRLLQHHTAAGGDFELHAPVGNRYVGRHAEHHFPVFLPVVRDLRLLG